MPFNPLTFISRTVDKFFRLNEVQKLSKSHPKLLHFLQRRLGMQNFLGLPLTLLLGIMVANLMLLTEIAENLVNSPGMKKVDSGIGMFLFHLRTDWVAQGFYYFTQLGSSVGVAIGFALVGLVLLFKKMWAFLVALIISVLGTGGSVFFTKLYFHRERPLDIGYYKPTSYSFPSGHSAEALALAGIVAVFLLVKRNHVRKANWWVGLCLAYILLIGFSRIYLGVHFISDVAGGYLLASLWLILATSVLEFLLLHHPAQSAKQDKLN